MTRCIILRWERPSFAAGFTDIIPMEWFATEGVFSDREHFVEGDWGEGIQRRSARCDLMVQERTADLNYQIHKGFNRTKRMEIGILRIGFVDRDRAAISEEVLWKDEGKARFQREQVDITVVEFPLNEDEADTEPFDPENVSDARNTIMRAIRERRGQQSFRDNLLGAYERRCAISGCEIVDVLEAAHITPYLGPDTNHVTNGLLLRADLHTLMDCGLLVIDPTTYAVVLAPALRAAPDYKGLHGRRLHDPVPISAAPSPKALKEALRGCWWYGAR